MASYHKIYITETTCASADITAASVPVCGACVMTDKENLPSDQEPEPVPYDDPYDYENYDEDTREACPVCGELFYHVKEHLDEEEDEDHMLYAVHES
jgi:hypothetical protein